MQVADSLSAEQHYLLGAELAQAGEYPRAVEEMTRAVELQPLLHTARLQLGLLHLTMGRPDAADEHWSHLRRLPEDGPMPHFAEGLGALARDDFDRCIAALEAGIRLNSTNSPLNGDMRRLIERVREQLSSRPPLAPNGGPVEPVRTDFSLYDHVPK